MYKNVNEVKKMSKIREILAANMRKYRAETGLSQEDLAAICGLHRTYISDVERCERNLSIDNIEKIANAFNISVAELLKE